MNESKNDIEIKSLRENSGNYSCRVKYGSLEKTNTIEIRVKFKPEAVEKQDTPQNFTIKENSSVTLGCNMTGEPEPEIEWEFKSAFDNRTTKHTGLQIVINSMALKNVGNYKCSAKNSQGSSEFNLEYNLEMSSDLSPAILDFKKKVIYIVSENDVELNCMCIGCAPLNISTWSYKSLDGNEEVLNSTLSNVYDGLIPARKSSYILKLANLSISNEGLYSCDLENEAGHDNEEINIKVIGKLKYFIFLTMYIQECK